MKKIQLLILAILLSTGAAQAQRSYNTGIGLRGGPYSGITFKHFLGSKTAFEGIVASRWEGLEFTGLVEFHNQFGDAKNFNWYYGFGGHIGSYHHDHTPHGHHHDHHDHDGTYTTIGADGIIGMEYTFIPVPINISLDYKPAINLIGGNYFASDAAAISVRFVF